MVSRFRDSGCRVRGFAVRGVGFEVLRFGVQVRGFGFAVSRFKVFGGFPSGVSRSGFAVFGGPRSGFEVFGVSRFRVSG